MLTLFDQEEAVNRSIEAAQARAAEEGLLLGAVGAYRELGLSLDEAVAKVAARFGFDPAEARAKTEACW